MTNAELDTLIDTNVTTNALNENTGADVNDVLKKMVRRLPKDYPVTLIVGITPVSHDLMEVPFHVSVWKDVGGGKKILLSNLETYTETADETSTVYINSPDAGDVIVKIG